MSNPNPLSDDWLSWDPETIHSYPDVGDSPELAGLAVVPEKITARRLPTRQPEAGVLVRELMRDVAAGVVSGLVAAILLALLIAFFPSATRAEGSEPVEKFHTVGGSCPNPLVEPPLTDPP